MLVEARQQCCCKRAIHCCLLLPSVPSIAVAAYVCSTAWKAHVWAFHAQLEELLHVGIAAHGLVCACCHAFASLGCARAWTIRASCVARRKCHGGFAADIMLRCAAGSTRAWALHFTTIHFSPCSMYPRHCHSLPCVRYIVRGTCAWRPAAQRSDWLHVPCRFHPCIS
jgi:hypothetical protein